MVILQTMGWFLENPNHGYYYNQHSHRLVYTCRKSPPLNLFVFVIAVKWKAIKLVPATEKWSFLLNLTAPHRWTQKLIFASWILIPYSHYESKCGHFPGVGKPTGINSLQQKYFIWTCPCFLFIMSCVLTDSSSIITLRYIMSNRWYLLTEKLTSSMMKLVRISRNRSKRSL